MVSLLSSSARDLLNVERAIHDIRQGLAVIIYYEGQTIAVMAADTLSCQLLEKLVDVTQSNPMLLLSAKRVQAAFPEQDIHHTSRIPLLLPIDKGKIYYYSGISSISNKEYQDSFQLSEPIDEVALALVKIAELIPSAIILSLADAQKATLAESPLLHVDGENILRYKENNTYLLHEVCEAPLCLEGAEDASIKVFRPELGGSEHYAIIIGNALNDESPLVRIHSSCYTGDLLRSLKCDCGDQLHGAIEFMGQKAQANTPNDSGGIIIYLMQEGRGIGLTNKLRAYDIQATGVDTVDANELLGFDDDERLFEPASHILQQMQISQIRLLSNNPRKAKEIERLGIRVTEAVPHIMQSHSHNDHYLRTKATRLGHHMPNLDQEKK